MAVGRLWMPHLRYMGATARGGGEGSGGESGGGGEGESGGEEGG